MASDRFDAVILGAGPAGEVVATRLGEWGMHVALLEGELVGGECAYWACIPSKTLLRPGEAAAEAARAPGTARPELDFGAIAKYRDFMIRDLSDAKEVESYERLGVTVIKEEGTLAGPGRVRAGARTLDTDRIVIATGTEPEIPPIDGLEQAGYWTNREATTFSEVPESAVILGGGPVGIELAQMLRRFGAHVELIEQSGRLLAREDARVSELITEALSEDGIGVHVGASAQTVASEGGRRTVALDKGETVSADRVIVATGRTPRVGTLSLETVGIEPTPRGIEVDERCRAADGIWAVGDVTGVMPFTHLAKYQGRLAAADIAGHPARADYSAIPRTVFCDPEVAAVGLTEEQARERGIDAVCARIELGAEIARPWVYETEPRGELCLIAERTSRRLVGAWAVAPLASEWIHYAALAIRAQVPVEVLIDTVAQFPSYTEGYLKALERLEL